VRIIDQYLINSQVQNIKKETEYYKFSDEIIESIKEYIAIAVVDVSIKDRSIGVTWILSDENNDNENCDDIWNWKWGDNTLLVAEALIILNFLQIIQLNIKGLKEDLINIFTNNKKIATILNKGIEKVSEGVKYTGLSLIEAIKIINKLLIKIHIDYTQGHPKPKTNQYLS